jgi:hypothetical protein
MAWSSVVRGLFFAAMAVFLVTIGIGILNGLDLVEFPRDALLTHVHTGTLGWITLSLVALSAWRARGIDRRLAWALAGLIPVYALAFLVAPAIRSVLGGLLLLAILWLVIWAWGRFNGARSVPSLAIALGFTTFAYGAIVGVAIQIQLAGGPVIFSMSEDLVGAHASAMVFGYLIIVATGLLEWRILGTAGMPRGGLVQVGALFLAGAALSLTLLFLPASALQPVGGLNLLLNLIAVAVFAVRILPRALRTDWLSGAGRHFAMSAIYVLVAMAFFLYLIFKVISDASLGGDITSLLGVLVASDHASFIGVVTNLVFGSLLVLTADRRDLGGWADQVAFWGTNIGLAVFLAGLASGTVILKQVGAPLMGVSLLVGLAALAMRLRSSSLAAAEG